jgi:hypothetical protein
VKNRGCRKNGGGCKPDRRYHGTGACAG